MKAHKLVDALSGVDPITLLYSGYGPDTAAGMMLPKLKEDIIQSHKFSMGNGYDLLHRDLVLTGEEGVLAGAIKMPFPICYFEFEVPQNNETYGLLAVEQNDPRYYVAVHPFVHRNADPYRGWADLGVVHFIDPFCGEKEEHYGIQPLMEEEQYIDIDNVMTISKMAVSMLIGSLAAINAKGVTTECILEPVKLNKTRTKRGVCPIFEHKVVHLGLPSNHSRSNGAFDQRSAPRLHWRRGHTRTLNTGTKTFVRAALVGDPSKGKIGKHYEFNHS